MNSRQAFTADLVAFVEYQDLPPSLYSFVSSTSWKDSIGVKKDTRIIILKIREVPDAYHAIIVNNNPRGSFAPARAGVTRTIEQIEAKIHKDLLGVVRLSEEAYETLRRLLVRVLKGEFAFFLNYQVSKATRLYKYHN
jgi:hypothetical protein